jgi:hypothetical protein
MAGLVCLGCHPWSVVAERKPVSTGIAAAASALLSSLGEGDRKRIQFSADDDGRFDWHYVPRERRGLAWGEMNEPQRKLATQLLRDSLSEAGFVEVEAIRDLEVELRRRENDSAIRDRDRFFFTVYGEPKESGTWSWRYEGHHLSLTFAFLDSRMVASTPQFLGVNPLDRYREATGPKLVQDAHEGALKFVQGLPAAIREVAIVTDSAPWDIESGTDRGVRWPEKKGVSWSRLDSEQREGLLRLLERLASVQSEQERDRRMKKLREADLSQLWFAWRGPTTARSRHYFCVQGPSILVELDNTQADGNHLHIVWRDPTEDFGDPLAEHRETWHHVEGDEGG